MISEEELSKLSYPEAPKIVTKIPGPKSQKILKDVPKYESLARPGGDRVAVAHLAYAV